MEILPLCALIYGVYLAIRWLVVRIRARRNTAQQLELMAARVKSDADRRRAEAHAEDRRRRAQNEQMQLALLQLDSAPDFRRAASFAAQAKAVPAEFRRRQFRRFRPKLLEHLLKRSAEGSSMNDMRESLAELVTHLGVAPFEADYLCQEADQRLRRREPAAPGFAAQLTALEREHRERITVLNAAEMADELREQLVEAEEQRYRDVLMQLNEAQGSGRRQE